MTKFTPDMIAHLPGTEDHPLWFIRGRLPIAVEPAMRQKLEDIFQNAKRGQMLPNPLLSLIAKVDGYPLFEYRSEINENRIFFRMLDQFVFHAFISRGYSFHFDPASMDGKRRLDTLLSRWIVGFSAAFQMPISSKSNLQKSAS